MASITIRKLPERTKEILRVKAAKSGVSLEAYARQILQKESGREATPTDIVKLAEKYFGAKGGVDLELPKRGSRRKEAEFHS